jgi:glucosylceramidase
LIASFRHRASAVVLWNLALDPRGGPVEPPNLGCRVCVGMLTIDEHAHRVSYRTDYYQLGQFSRFVDRGAHRVASNTFVSYQSPTRTHPVNWATAGVDDVAFVNPNGSLVVLAHNNARQPRRFAVAWHGQRFTYALPGNATVTFAWRP